MHFFSIANASLCAAIAVVLFTCIGFAVTCSLIDRRLALAVAPLSGWAIYSAVTLPFFCVVGFAPPIVATVLVAFLVAAALLIRVRWNEARRALDDGALPAPAWIAAAVIAAMIAWAIVPTVGASGVALRPPIFDHAKIAIIDEIVRSGVPAANPFFADEQGRGALAYYYLWHFSAAQLAIVTGASGWEADAALTWFTSFAGLSLIMGLAVWLGRSRWAWLPALLFAMTGSLRPVLSMLFGRDGVIDVAGLTTGFSGWLFQSAWAPNHVASAGCATIAVVVLRDLAREQSVGRALLLATLAAASYGSSVWVGAITFPLASLTLAISIFARGNRADMARLVVFAAGAALVAGAIASPFIAQQLSFVGVRGETPAIVVQPYEVIGADLAPWLRALLDPLAYWLILLPVEYHVIYIAGVVMAVWLVRDRNFNEQRGLTALVLLALTSLGVGAFLGSAIGDNNDLAWRGVLPALIALVAISAAGVDRYWRVLSSAWKLAIVMLTAAALFDGGNNLRNNLVAKYVPSSQTFAASAAMWDAVRKASRPNERVLNNPYFASSMTPWPINISWALLADRRSCYAGDDYLKPFTSLNARDRNDTVALIERIFNGKVQPGDVDWLASRGHCEVVIITPEDGSWNSDPLIDSGHYSVADRSDRWRIYRRK